jgi:exopolysaccharide biosynthesis protein
MRTGLRWLGRIALVPLALYAAMWAVPGWHRLAVESVVTSGHAPWARWMATPGQLNAWSAAWRAKPTLSTVTPVVGDGAVADPSGVVARPIAGPHYRGWLLVVPDPRWLHVALTPRLGRLGEPTSWFGAHTPGAIAAFNGGGFVDPGGTGTGGLPVGPVVQAGRLRLFPDPTNDELIGFDARGRLVVGPWSAGAIRAHHVVEAVAFKPLLVLDGRPLITRGDGGWGIGPRTVLGQRRDGTVLVAVADGRQIASPGATLRQMQDLMLSEGAVTAVNLDGGSSSTLWFRGRVLNHPCCSPNGQRYVPTAWVVVPGSGPAPPTPASAPAPVAGTGSRQPEG